MPQTVLMFAGPPASGKTWLMSKVAAKMGIASVSFDDIERNLRHNQEFSPLTYAAGRKQFLESIRGHLKSGCDVIAIEDTFHLKAMRRQIRTICEQWHTGLAVVQISADLDTLLERNAHRESEVTPAALSKIACNFDDILPREYSKDALLRLHSNVFMTTPPFDQISQIISSAQSHLLEPTPEPDAADLERQKQIIQKSLLHQVDLALRKAVGSWAKQGHCVIAQTLRSVLLDSLRRKPIQAPLSSEKLPEVQLRRLNAQLDQIVEKLTSDLDIISADLDLSCAFVVELFQDSLTFLCS